MVVCPPPKNREGLLGPPCRVCDGWGFLLGIKSSGSCRDCRGSGVEQAAFDDPAVKAYLARMRAEIQAAQQRAAALDPGLPAALELQRLLDIKCSRQFWSEMIWWATASGATVASSTTETIIFPNVTIPANYLQDGRALRLRVQGQHTTPGTGAVTLIFQLRWGGVAGTVISKTGTITTLISLTAAVWDLDILVQTRSNGATGTVMSIGKAMVYGATVPTIGSATGAPAIAPMTQGGQITPATATLDLTADTALSITGQMGQSNAGCTFIGLNYIGESLN
jgi:hypothetical protein